MVPGPGPRPLNRHAPVGASGVKKRIRGEMPTPQGPDIPAKRQRRSAGEEVLNICCCIILASFFVVLAPCWHHLGSIWAPFCALGGPGKLFGVTSYHVKVAGPSNIAKAGSKTSPHRPLGNSGGRPGEPSLALEHPLDRSRRASGATFGGSVFGPCFRTSLIAKKTGFRRRPTWLKCSK